MKNKRRRRKPQRKSSNTLYWVVGIVVGVVLIALLGQSLFAPATDGAVAASQLIDPSQYVEQFGDDESHLLLDVRTPEEFNSGHIEGAVNINVETLASRLEEVPRDMPIVVYCQHVAMAQPTARKTDTTSTRNATRKHAANARHATTLNHEQCRARRMPRGPHRRRGCNTVRAVRRKVMLVAAKATAKPQRITHACVALPCRVAQCHKP